MKYNYLLKNKSKIIPIFFACDDKFVPYMMVTMKSLIKNSSFKRTYKIHVLHTDISIKNQGLVKTLETENCKIEFNNVTKQLEQIEKKITLRDYYSATTYYRLFIADMFPEYDKVAYIDSDTIVLKDIANFVDYDLEDNYIGAVRDQLVAQTDIYGDYVEKVLGLSRETYFNAGVVLINCKQFRKKGIQKQFVDFLNTYRFVVAQDQDYLNILCKNKVLWIDGKWNVQMIGKPSCPERDFALIHYNLAAKPWHYEDCRYGHYFWDYAKLTPGYDTLKAVLDNFSEADAKKDADSGENLLNLAISEINNENNFFKQFGRYNDASISRIAVLKKIEELEKAGRFDEDVEEDPPSKELKPEDINYLHKTLTERMRTKYAFKLASWFLNALRRNNQFIVEDIIGIENYRDLDSGAIITCNHFSPLDSFVMEIAYRKSHQRLHRRKFFRIIREGNYTSFPGFYGFLMRNCNTLPLSSNKSTMKKFIKAVDKLLQKGQLILIYPEQSMWWNYRKPKPVKKGGFTFAAKNNVPVLPCFITMEDSEFKDGDGLPVQKYTINIAKPIYPDKNKSMPENVEYLIKEHNKAWKEIYEKAYGIPLTYTCDENN